MSQTTIRPHGAYRPPAGWPLPAPPPPPQPAQTQPAGATIPVGLFVAVLALTAVLASVLALIGGRWVLARTGDATRAPAPAPAARTTAVAGPASSRLSVTRPRRVLDARTGPDGERNLPLPSTGTGTTAVLLQVSVLHARRPGLVTVRSQAEDLPTLRIGAAGGQSTATVVAVPGADHRLRVRNGPGGRIVVQLIGTFESARTASAGRLVLTAPRSVVRLVPVVDGHDAVLHLRGAAALHRPGRVSAVLLRFAGEVGPNGGHVAVGRARRHLDQRVLWSATAGSGPDVIRNGLMVVPVDPEHADRLYLHYKAGTELRAELVGYVTGPAAARSATGLGVPVPARQAPAVRVAAAGRKTVTLVPDAGVAGVRPDRVAAALSYLSVTGEAPGPVSVLAPGGRPTSVPDLSAAARTRSALALSGVDRGRVTLVSGSGAAVILTPRLLILR